MNSFDELHYNLLMKFQPSFSEEKILKASQLLRMSERSIFTYAKLNDLSHLRSLIEDEDVDVNEIDDYGRTALHICATHDSLDSARELLKHPYIRVDLQDYESGWTPLHRALYFKNFKIALSLIKCGAKLGDEFSGDWRSSVATKRDTNRSIRSYMKWTPNIDHEGHTPLDLLSCSLVHELTKSKKSLYSTSILTFGKIDYVLGIVLPNSVGDIYRPRRIETLESKILNDAGYQSIISISSSKYHSIAISKDGKCFSWGHGRSGRLGHSDEVTYPEPRCIRSLIPYIITQVAISENHSLAVTNHGILFSWGSNRYGQLGHSYDHTNAISGTNTTSGYCTQPRQVKHLQKCIVIGIAAGDTHSVCYTDDGSIYAWGSNKNGQLGLKNHETSSVAGNVPGVPTPKKVSSMQSIISDIMRQSTHLEVKDIVLQISASSDSTLLLCRGRGKRDETTSRHTSPRTRHDSIDSSIADTPKTADQRIITHYNEVYQWGYGNYQPMRIMFYSPTTTSTMKCNCTSTSSNNSTSTYYGNHPTHNYNSSSSNNNVYNHSNKCVHEFCQSINQSFATQPYVQVTQIAAGRYHNVALTSLGHVYTWGLNSDHLGYITPSMTSSSVNSALTSTTMSGKVTSQSYATNDMDSSILKSSTTTAPLSSTSKMKNAYPNTNLSTTNVTSSSTMNTPQIVETLLPENGGGRMVYVNVSSHRTCVISENGDLYTWGSNELNGILGHGNSKYQPIPKRVVGVKKAISVACGENHTLVLQSASLPELPLSHVFIDNSKVNDKKKSYGIIDGDMKQSGANRTLEYTDDLIVPHDNYDDMDEVTHILNMSLDSTNDVPSDDDEEEDININIKTSILHNTKRSQPSLLITSNITQNTITYMTHVPSLKSLCEREIAKEVNLRTVLSIMSLSHTFFCPELLSYCNDFVKRNLDAVLVETSLSEIDVLLEALESNIIQPTSSSSSTTSTSNTNGKNTSQKVSSKDRHMSSGGTLSTTPISDMKKDKRSGSISDNIGKKDGRANSIHNVMYSDTKERTRGSSFDETIKSKIGRSDSHSSNVGNDIITTRDRALSKDLDSMESVKKLIRAVKKKLSSIEEIENKILIDVSMEQQEKLNKKASLIGELKRLKFILTRIESEEKTNIPLKIKSEDNIKDNGMNKNKIDNGIAVQLFPDDSTINTTRNTNINQSTTTTTTTTTTKDKMKIISPPKFDAWSNMISVTSSTATTTAPAAIVEIKNSVISKESSVIVGHATTAAGGSVYSPASISLNDYMINSSDKKNKQKNRAKNADTLSTSTSSIYGLQSNDTHEKGISLSTIGMGGRTILSPPISSSSLTATSTTSTTTSSVKNIMANSSSNSNIQSKNVWGKVSNQKESNIVSYSHEVFTSKQSIQSQTTTSTSDMKLSVPISNTPIKTVNRVSLASPVSTTITTSSMKSTSNLYTGSESMQEKVGLSLSQFIIKSPNTMKPSSTVSTNTSETVSKNPWGKPVVPVDTMCNTSTVAHSKSSQTQTTTSSSTNVDKTQDSTKLVKSLLEIQKEEEALHQNMFTQRNCIIDKYESAWSVGVVKGNAQNMKEVMKLQEQQECKEAEELRRKEELLKEKEERKKRQKLQKQQNKERQELKNQNAQESKVDNKIQSTKNLSNESKRNNNKKETVPNNVQSGKRNDGAISAVTAAAAGAVVESDGNVTQPGKASPVIYTKNTKKTTTNTPTSSNDNSHNSRGGNSNNKNKRDNPLKQNQSPKLNSTSNDSVSSSHMDKNETSTITTSKECT